MKTLYVVQVLDATGHIKIGTTKDIDRRLRELRRHEDGDVRVLRTENVESGIEPVIQRRFAEWQVRQGHEWFAPDPEVLGPLLAWPIDKLAERPPKKNPGRQKSTVNLPAEIAAIGRLGRLTGNMIAVMAMRRDMTYAELGELMGVTRQAVSQMVRTTRLYRHTTHAVLAAFAKYDAVQHDRPTAKVEPAMPRKPRPGPKPYPPGKKRTESVTVTLNPGELRTVTKAAGEQSLSAYIREAALAAAEEASGDG